MLRQEALDYLKQFIPSFRQEFAQTDLYGELGWMCADGFGLDLPEVIPPHYLEGIELTHHTGEKKVTVAVHGAPFYEEYKRQKGIPEGRECHLTYLRYPGNPHWYGHLNVAGLECVVDTGEPGRYVTTGIGGETHKDHPELRNARSCWEFELMRIVTDGDEKSGGDWNLYPVGVRTNRFLRLKELYATALYLALRRVGGPFYLLDKDGYGYCEYDKDCCQMIVHEDDTVDFMNQAKEYFFDV